MKRIRIVAASGLLAGLFCGCSQQAATTTDGSANVDPNVPTHAQPRLPTIQLWVGAKPMTAEMAVTLPQIMTGEMFRTNLVPDEGMIFVLPSPQRAAFWMKNCPLPLDAAYITPDGTIAEIHPLEPKNTNSVMAGTDNILFVLETPRGWFKNNNVSPGTVIATEKGSLYKTFIGGN